MSDEQTKATTDGVSPFTPISKEEADRLDREWDDVFMAGLIASYHRDMVARMPWWRRAMHKIFLHCPWCSHKKV